MENMAILVRIHWATGEHSPMQINNVFCHIEDSDITI